MDRIYLNDVLKEQLGEGYEILERIYGGMMNLLFLVQDKDEKKYVVFVPNGKANKAVNRKFEKETSDIVADLGITARYKYFDTRRGIKIRDYIEGEPLNKYKGEIDYQKVADLLHLLHDSKLLAPNEYSPLSRLSNYENRALSYAKESNEYRSLKDFFAVNIGYLNTKEHVLCHNDFQKSNIIISPEGKYYIIDFEFAGNNDPVYDIATFANDSIDDGEKLLDCYYNYAPTIEQKRRFYLWRIFVSLQWSNVAVAKHYQKEGKNTSFNFLDVARYFIGNGEEAKRRFLLLKK